MFLKTVKITHEMRRIQSGITSRFNVTENFKAFFVEHLIKGSYCKITYISMYIILISKDRQFTHFITGEAIMWCATVMDVYGYHALVYRFHLFPRHNQARNALCDLMVKRFYFPSKMRQFRF